jgi:nucleoside-diphosphate kinase
VSERTLVLVKPDGVSRGLVGEVIAARTGQRVRGAARTLIRPLRSVRPRNPAQRSGGGTPRPTVGDTFYSFDKYGDQT